MDTLNPFKTWLAENRATPPLGSWLMSAAPSTAEAMGHCGFDFLVVDMEHVPVEVPDMVAILRAMSGTPAQPVVRLAWSDQVLVKRVLDAGARSLMFPFIENAEEAAEAVRFTRYPPDGVRGVAAVHRASQFGRIPNYLARANDSVAVIVQLETPGAIDRLPEIAAVPGVDALFVGPGDLSASMGLMGQIGHDDVQAAIARAAEMAKAAGKPIGIVGPNPDMVRRFLSYGYDYAAIASDMAMMIGRAVDWLGALREAPPSAAPTAAY
ncbi:MAG: aldolase/citrate lyase family protein [Aliidongia sp.]